MLRDLTSLFIVVAVTPSSRVSVALPVIVITLLLKRLPVVVPRIVVSSSVIVISSIVIVVAVVVVVVGIVVVVLITFLPGLVSVRHIRQRLGCLERVMAA